MTLQSVCGATVVVFAFGMVTVEPAFAQRRDGSLLPQEESGNVTAVGCLVRGESMRGGKSDKYVLARPKAGPVASVAEASCTADPGADALTLDNPSKGGMTDSMLGRWVEISGRLERETNKDPDDLRELDVLTAKMVPVVIPRPPAPTAAREPIPAPEPPLQAAPVPVATSGPEQLPATASNRPAIGLVGLLLLAGSGVFRSLRVRRG